MQVWGFLVQKILYFSLGVYVYCVCIAYMGVRGHDGVLVLASPCLRCLVALRCVLGSH